MVDLEQPGLRILVQEDVEAKDLEAQTVLQVIWLRCSVGMRQAGLGCDERLQYDILDRLPDLLRGDHGLTLLQEMLAVVYRAEDSLEAALVAHVVPLGITVEDELHALFVDCVVSQMHHHVIQVAWARLLVLLRRETRETLLGDVGTEGIDTCHQNVDTQVKFKARYEVRFVEVPLSHEVFVGVLHPVEAPCQEYSLALAAGLGLDDECLRLFIIELDLEVLGILGEDPGGREEFVLFRALPLHCLEVTR